MPIGNVKRKRGLPLTNQEAAASFHTKDLLDPGGEAPGDAL